MKKRFLAVFSGFPDHHFSEEIAERLRKELTERRSIVFITACPFDYAQNDDDCNGMYEMFSEQNMPFEKHCVIDMRTEPSKAKALVENADCIFLMGGGVCEEQLDLIRKKDCYEALLNCHAAIFGVSAGSMNMAKNTVDFFESMEPFDGLGFTNITVSCHHDPDDTWRYEQTLRMSEDRVVYAMEDMSAFFIKGGKIDTVGKIYRVENRELRLLTEDDRRDCEKCRCTGSGRRVANREVPVLRRAKDTIEHIKAEIGRGNVTKTKQFQILTDINLVWDFLTDIYDRENGSGVAAPFFEHAILASWMDNSYSYLNRFWFDGERIVAFVFYEAPATDIYFSVRKGYEYLAGELIDYAMTTMPNWDGEQQLVLFNGQEYLMEAAKKRGFKMVYEYEDRYFDFKNELNYELPEGYHFVEAKDIDTVKIGKLCWYGFDHGEKGEFVNWDKQDTSLDWTPEKSYKDCLGLAMAPLPHSTPEYNVVIADEQGEYVCFSGMWWVPQNKLAYMEPLCTVPGHRRKGLAAAALTVHYRRMKALGATHMTGGGDPFYEKIGYGKGLHWSFWKKD